MNAAARKAAADYGVSKSGAPPPASDVYRQRVAGHAAAENRFRHSSFTIYTTDRVIQFKEPARREERP